MTLLAVTLTHAARAELRLLVGLAFLLYVLLSLVAVAAYTTKKVRTNRLVDGKRAPLCFPIPPAGEWLFALNVLALVFVQSIVYVALILAALLILFLWNRRLPGRGLVPQAGGWLFILNVLLLLLLQSPLYMMLVLSSLAFLLLESRRTARRQLGLARLTARQLISWSLLICGAVVAVEAPLMQALELIMNAAHLPHPEQPSVESFREFTRTSQILDFMILAVFISPMIEELFFRGFLLTFLKNYTSTWVALILSAGVFAFAHVNLGSVIPLWLLGIVLGVAYEHTGSILLPMGIHACFNLITALSLLLEKGSS